MQDDEPKKIWFLNFGQDGRPRFKWQPLLLLIPMLLLGQSLGLLFLIHFVGVNPNAFSLPFLAMMAIPPVAWFLLTMSITYDREMARYRGETPGFQFGLRNIFLLTLALCAWLACTTAEINRNARRHDARNAFVAELAKFAPQGKVRYSGGTNELQVVIKSPSFDDEDFHALVRSLEASPDKAYIYSLSLTGTSITDQSLALMSDWHGLKYLYLNDTAVTDQGVRSLESLSQLLQLTVGDTSVTAEYRAEFRTKNPKVNVSPFN